MSHTDHERATVALVERIELEVLDVLRFAPPDNGIGGPIRRSPTRYRFAILAQWLREVCNLRGHARDNESPDDRTPPGLRLWFPV